MSNKKNKKGSLETESFEIVAVKDLKMKPFLNVFSVSGQNIQQQKLGKMFGIIQIEDTSENSAYLSNMLTQIAKKSYFKNKNKTCGESFEIALHKMNLTLTELTQHEIVEWINNLNAAIGVICGDEIHFAQVGNGRILFFRNEKISTIGQNSKKTEDYHPMKTFSTISTGRIKENEKIIFTLQNSLNILQEEQLERHFKTFNSKEFDNIVSSTLQNEGQNTGMVIVNNKNQKDELTETAPEIKKNNVELNFFGEEIQKEDSAKEELPSQKDEIIEEKTPSLDPNQSPFDKEPEIFLKEESNEEVLVQESTANKNQKIEILIKQLNKKIVSSKDWIISRFISGKNYSAKITQDKKTFFKKVNTKKVLERSKELLEKIKDLALSETARFKDHLKRLKKNTQEKSFFDKIRPQIRTKKFFEIRSLTQINFNFKDNLRSILNSAKEHIKNLKSKDWLNKKNIILSVLAASAIFIILFILISKTNSKKENLEAQTPSKIISSSNPFNEKSSDLKNFVQLIKLNQKIKDSTFHKNNLYLLTEENNFIEYSIRDNTANKIKIPVEFNHPQYLTSLHSLNLILLINKNSVFVYSPITKKFSRNNIKIPQNIEPVGAGSYLTYLYLLDKNNNQIYRYHRATGGFGSHQNWLEEPAEFENVTSFDISDSIYIGFNNGIIKKYFNNKKEAEFNLENDLVPNKIKVGANQDEIFALDKKQGKILKLSEKKNSKIIFQNQKFKDAADFYVDFEDKKVFVISKEGNLMSFNYNN